MIRFPSGSPYFSSVQRFSLFGACYILALTIFWGEGGCNHPCRNRFQQFTYWYFGRCKPHVRRITRWAHLVIGWFITPTTNYTTIKHSQPLLTASPSSNIAFSKNLQENFRKTIFWMQKTCSFAACWSSDIKEKNHRSSLLTQRTGQNYNCFLVSNLYMVHLYHSKLLVEW